MAIVDLMEIREMTLDDLKFFNRVRSSSVDYIHDKVDYSYGDNIIWFNKLEHPYFILLIGDVRIAYFRTAQWDTDAGSAYIGMDMAEEHRGKGYANPAYEKFFEILAKDYGMNKLYVEILTSNRRSLHVMNKLGFTVTELLPYNDKEQSIKMELELWS